MELRTNTAYRPEVLAGFDRLSATLAKVPPDRIPLVDERASIFISGMEAMARITAAPPAPAERGGA